MLNSNRLTLEAFTRHVDSTFRVYPAEGPHVDMTLVRTTQLRRDSLTDSWSLSFRAPDAPALDQGTYQFEHAQMGAFQCFIVPYKQVPGHRYYEATFNLLLRPLRID